MRFHPLLLALVPGLAAVVPLPKDEAALEIRTEDDAVRRDWALNELEWTLGEEEWNPLVSVARTKYFRELQGGLRSELMFSGTVPEDATKMLRIAERLWNLDRAGLANRHELTTVAAVALMCAQRTGPKAYAARKGLGDKYAADRSSLHLWQSRGLKDKNPPGRRSVLPSLPQQRAAMSWPSSRWPRPSPPGTARNFPPDGAFSR